MSATQPIGLSALAELRVVELGVWVAAPSAAALLADWGADVIKIESPTGDPMRHAFGSLGIDKDFPNPAFAQDNRGKRSVVLDLREQVDRCLLYTSPARATRQGPAWVPQLGFSQLGRWAATQQFQ